MSSKDETTEPQELGAPQEATTGTIEETILSAEETKLEETKLEDSKKDVAVIPRLDTQEPTEKPQSKRENSLVEDLQDFTKATVVNEQQETKSILAESTETSVVLPAGKQEASVSAFRTQKEQEIWNNVTTQFSDNTTMDYLHWEALMENQGGNVTELTDYDRISSIESQPSLSARQCDSYPSSRQATSGKACWQSNSPALEKAEHNGETLMLPKIAPRDEPQVTIRNITLNQTISTIENHQGGSKVNWFWKTQLFHNRMASVVPVACAQAKQMLPSLKQCNTINLYTFSDVKLCGNTINQDLPF